MPFEFCDRQIRTIFVVCVLVRILDESNTNTKKSMHDRDSAARWSIIFPLQKQKSNEKQLFIKIMFNWMQLHCMVIVGLSWPLALFAFRFFQFFCAGSILISSRAFSLFAVPFDELWLLRQRADLISCFFAFCLLCVVDYATQNKNKVHNEEHYCTKFMNGWFGSRQWVF